MLVFGPAKKPPPPEPEEEESALSRTLTALEEVCAWRFVGLLRLGFEFQQAVLLVNRPDVVHDAKALLDRGCPVDFVFEELRPNPD